MSDDRGPEAGLKGQSYDRVSGTKAGREAGVPVSEAGSYPTKPERTMRLKERKRNYVGIGQVK